MAVNLNSLRLFEAVARAGSFTRAAEAARVSQPAISKAVRELERSLAVALFERGARGARLTEAGEVLAEHARAIFALARTADEDMRAFREIGRGTLRIGASTTIATYLLPPLLGRFVAEHPSVDIRLTSANTQEIVQRLLAYELDVALVEGPVAERRIAVIPWREDELVLIAPSGHPLARRAVGWAQVVRESLLVREAGSGTGEVVATALEERGLVAGRTMELGSTEAIKQAVAAGLGLAFVSRSAAADQLALGTVAVVEVRSLQVRRTLTRLALVDRRPSPTAQAFESVLENHGDRSAV
jgi:DNA-binding transcriptional LysR family regulator